MALTIGKLAKNAEVNVETIRYYQRVGLLKEPLKPTNGYRQYSSDYISRIHFIKRAKHLGFTLKEIRELLLLGDRHCDDVKSLAKRKLHNIEVRINDLQAVRQVLGNLIDSCDAKGSELSCSIIGALSDRSDKSRD